MQIAVAKKLESTIMYNQLLMQIAIAKKLESISAMLRSNMKFRGVSLMMNQSSA